MGVTGLLKLLQPVSEQRTASHFKGKTLGVDGYSWLHRAAASCAEDLIRGIPTPRLVQSIDNRVRVYEQYGVTLYFVFDGGRLAMKERVEAQRKRVREAARAQSSTTSTTGYKSALRGVDITAKHAAMVIAYLKARGIKFVVAPFEADAQLVYLESEGIIDGIISEDSDMLVFGARTLLTKSDPRTGSCIEISRERIPAPLSELHCLRALAILSGCDYSPGVPGLGPVKSRAMITRYGGELELMVSELMNNGSRIDPDFREIAQQADLAFQFQRVWNPQKCCITHLNTPHDGVAPLLTDHIVGVQLSRVVAHKIAVGAICPEDRVTELIVEPVIAQYVQRMRPSPSGSRAHSSLLSTPLGVNKVINNRLATPSTGSSPISSFFKTKPKPRTSPVEETKNKENTFASLPTPSPGTTTANWSTTSSSSSSTSSSGSSTRRLSISEEDAQPSKVMRTDTIVDSPLGSRGSSRTSTTTVSRTAEPPATRSSFFSRSLSAFNDVSLKKAQPVPYPVKIESIDDTQELSPECASRIARIKQFAYRAN